MLPNQYPIAPEGMVMSPLYPWILVINAVVLLGIVGWTVVECRRAQRWLPVAILVGSAFACLMECFFDVMVAAWWPQYGHTPLYRLFNISVPLWMLLAYPWFFGGMGVMCYLAFRQGMSPARLWRIYWLGWLTNMALEIPALQLGNVYAYYGPQPFTILGFPLWMAMTNSLVPIFIGALMVSLDDILRGPRTLLAIALVPMAIGAAEISAGWPIWLALHSGEGLVITRIAALVTFAFSLLITYLVGLKFCQHSVQTVPSSRRTSPRPMAAR